MSWEDMMVEEAKRRREVFRNLDKYLSKVCSVVKTYDEDAEVYLFGSVLQSRHLLSSDIDVLIVTDMHPGEMLAVLWNEGFEDPFEFHVVSRDKAQRFIKRLGRVRKIG